MQSDQKTLLEQVERLWQFGAYERPSSLLGRILHPVILRLLGPLIRQQREFNGALVKLIYGIQAQHEQAESYGNALMAQIVALHKEMRARDDVLHDHVGRVVDAMRLLDDAVAAADEADAALAAHLASMRLGQTSTHKDVEAGD